MSTTAELDEAFKTNTLQEFRDYCNDLARRANETKSVASIQTIAGAACKHFLDDGLRLYGLHGMLKLILASIESDFVDYDDHDDHDDDE